MTDDAQRAEIVDELRRLEEDATFVARELAAASERVFTR
jgi:hypothetical protein